MVLRSALIACAFALLAACARPQVADPQTDARAPAASTSSDARVASASGDVAPARADATPSAGTEPANPAPPKSTQLPPEVEAPARGAPTLKTSCRTDADCAVKNVGNCCGAMPACVSKDSPTDPAAVKAECARTGMMSTCGFKDIQACSCVAGTCQDAGGSSSPVAQ